ncbi:hypothetical protein PENTCL1PPCAC_23748, partial [Pristionchus entomophagus]
VESSLSSIATDGTKFHQLIDLTLEHHKEERNQLIKRCEELKTKARLVVNSFVVGKLKNWDNTIEVSVTCES